MDCVRLAKENKICLQRFSFVVWGLCAVFLTAICCVSPALAQIDATRSSEITQALKDFSPAGGNINMIAAASDILQTGSFDWGKTVANLLFSGIGFVAFVYGKKNSLWRPMALGIGLMVYPYMVSGTVMVFAIGIGLTAALYFWRE